MVGEFRTYHRKDGLIVKLRDDLMSASRIGLMMRRYARTGDGKKTSLRVVPKYRTGEGRDTLWRRRVA
jgi:hypothetical protein